MMRTFRKLLTIALCLAMVVNMCAFASETCAHGNTSMDQVLDWDSFEGYEQYNYQYHIVLIDLYDREYCLDCEENLNRVLKNVDVFMYHNYDGGTVCVDCGYDSSEYVACTHEGMKLILTYDSSTTVYAQVDAMYHAAA